MKKLFIHLLFFLYIFGPVFNSVGPWVDFIFFSSLFFIIINILTNGIKIPKYILIFSSVFIVYLYSAVFSIFYVNIELHNVFDLLFRPIRIILTIFGGYSLISISRNNFQKYHFNEILIYIYVSIFLHALIMVLQFHFPEFKAFLYSYTMGSEPRSTFEYDFRMGGLSGSTGGAILSIVQSFGIIIIPFLLKQYSSLKLKFIILFSSSLIFYSVFICGRSGIWSIIIFTLISILIANASSFYKLIFIFTKSVLVLIISISIILVGFRKLEENSPLFFALNRTFDTFINFSNSNNFEDKTVTTLQSHILFPNSLSILFFGSSEVLTNTQFDRNLDSDIGYIRNIWGFGVFLTLLYWFPIFYFFILAIKRKNKTMLVYSFIVISLMIILFHAKEISFYTRMLLSIYSLLLAAIKLSHEETSKISN